MDTRTRLLIVDSDERSTQCWRRVLQDRAGLELDLVTTLGEAIDVFDPPRWSTRAYEIVFLDLHLSDGSGADLFPFIERVNPKPRVAVIASRLDGRSALFLQEKCAIALQKPLDRDSVLHVLRLLERHRTYAIRLREFAIRFRLSEREAQVVLAAVRGLNNDEIASELSCDRSTISTYWSRIFRKTATNCQRGVLALIIRSSYEGAAL